jgi:glycosyltransferase involved in cell wall biosynthesis
MRVGMIGPALDASGGIATVARTLLAASALQGVEVRYFPSVGDGALARKLGTVVAGQARFLATLARGWRPHLFHLHCGAPVPGTPAPPGRFTSFWRKLLYAAELGTTGRPFLLHVHGSSGFERLHDDSTLGARASEWLIERSAGVIVVSRQMAPVIRRWTGGSVPVHVLYNPVIPAQFSPVAYATKSPVVLFMGQICPAKGAFDLLSVLPRVAAAVPDAEFLFAGTGDVAALRREASRLGVGRRLHTPGWLGGAAKADALARAAVFCLPSRYEGLPVSVLEAMAAGLPVVATPIAGIPEAVVEGLTGFLVAPGDRQTLGERVVHLLRHPELRERMGRQGRQRAESHFDREVLARRLLGMWEDVLGAGRCR